jgi:hypothetical protein
MGETVMYQVSERLQGKCLLCPGTTDVVELKKDGQSVRLCKRHLWDALKDGEKRKPSSTAEKGSG